MEPRARHERLVVQELAEEVLVYDLDRHKAHCLNRTAALIWRRCDGQTTVAEMARLLQKELKSPVDEALVWLALDRLAKARLLRERVELPVGLSRREAMRKLALVGGLAALLPVVSTIAAPTAVQAASTCTRAECRAGNQANNCAGCLNLDCSDRPGKKCTWEGSCDCR